MKTTSSNPAGYVQKREPGFYVEVVNSETQAVTHAIGPIATEGGAEKTERGVNINLNHEDYFTRIVGEKS